MALQLIACSPMRLPSQSDTWAMNPWLPGSAILGINTFAPAAVARLSAAVDAGLGREIGHRSLPRRLVAFALHQAAADAVGGVREERDLVGAESLGFQLAVEQLLVEGGRAPEIGYRDFAPDHCVLHFSLLQVKCGIRTAERMKPPC